VFATCLFQDPELASGWTCSLSEPVEIFDGPDLGVGLEIDGDAPFTIGAPFEAIVHIENRGSTPSEPTALRIRAGRDAQPTPIDPELGAPAAAPALEAGAATTLAIASAAPPVPGHYQVGACTDPVAGDEQGANHCSPPRAIDVVEAVGLAEAVDNHRLVFRTSGSAPWFGQTAVHDGDGDAARSAPPGNGGAALLTTHVEGPGRLSWRWRVDSERDHDLLTTTVDGVEVQRASGRTGFARRAVRIDTPGAHEIAWQYAKDASGHAGADAVWLDRVLWQPGTGSVVRDFDGDGDADALIRHADGRWRLFELERGERVSDSSPRLFADPTWQLDAIADFDDDGDADILLVNPAAGARRLFTMERLAVAGSHWLPLPATADRGVAA
jgi:hypothetical protein